MAPKPKEKKTLNPYQHFEKSYWDKNYDEPETMDGICNAREHCRYLKAFFDLYLIEITSIIDFGPGLGILFQNMLKTFLPIQAIGLESSQYAFEKLQKKIRPPVESTQIELLHQDLKTWASANRTLKKNNPIDLGVCTSVLQYIPEQELPPILSSMSHQVKYLYLSVPTTLESKRMLQETDFSDPYALHRSEKFYKKIIAPHFTIVSKGVLESKVYFKAKTTLINELLFRF